MILIQRLVSPFQVNQGEAINVEFARILLRGEPLYHDPAQAPHLFSVYPPLFGLLQNLLSLGLKGLWLPGRLLAFSGYLGCAAGLAVWGWCRWGKAPTLALVSLFLLSPTWASWGSMVRPDTFMIFLEFTAFLLLARVSEIEAENKKAPARLLVSAGILMASAFLIKQNAILLIGAYGFYCLLERRWKNLGLFYIWALLPPLAVSAALQIMTQGWYLKYTARWVSFGFDPSFLIYYLEKAFLPECGWLVAAVLICWWKGQNSVWSKCALIFSFLWVVGLGRETSAENYYLEFFIFGIYFFGEGLSLSAGGLSKSKGWALPLALVGCLVLGLFFLNLKSWPLAPAQDVQDMKRSVLAIYQGPGEHLALDLDLPLMAGKRLWVQPLEYTLMVKKGTWSAEPLMGEIQAKKYATIELYDLPAQTLLPHSVVEEIQKNYHAGIRKYGRLWYFPN